MKHYDYILVDLDGTLIESAESVRVSLAHAMDALGLPCPDLSDYTKYVGPPLEDTFRGMCAVPEDQIERGMILYRDYYDEVGQKTNKLFTNGIQHLLSLSGTVPHGFSAAASLIQNGIGCLLLIVANHMVKAISPEGGAI